MIKKPEIASKKGSSDVKMQPGIVSSSKENPSYQETFDTSLLVGPVYVSSTNRKKAVIKQELSDITKRLHQTLYTYDTLDEYSAEATSKDSYVSQVRERINSLESEEMRDQLNVFIGRYEEMSTSVATANKERDDLLLELADGDSSTISEKEEMELSKSYAETVATFEKLKRIQEQMTADPSKKNKILAAEKRQVGKKVFDNIQLMKTISIQTMKIPGDTTDFSPWKDAADEIVGMMKKVREESSEEAKALSAKVYQLLSELEKQQQIVKRLNKEIKREKIVKGQLADDCTDLKVQLVEATETVQRYKEDLKKAKKFIEKQLKELERRKRKEESNEEEEESEEEEETKQKLSSIVAQLSGRDDGPKEMPSDPFILRTRIRQQEDTIEALKKELKETDLKVREFEPRLEAKDATLTELENENKSLSTKVDELNADLLAKENEIKKLAAAVKKASSRPPPPCKKCSRAKPAVTPEKKVPGDEIKDTTDQLKAKDAEIEQLTHVVQQYKKLLAETEMKLSEAFREISDLRLLQSDHIFPDQKLPEFEPKLPPFQQLVVPEPRKEVEMEEGESVQEVPPVQEAPIEPTEIPAEEEETPVEQEEENTEVEDVEEETQVEIKRETVKAEKPIKPKTAVLPIEKQKTRPKRLSRKEKTKLPSLVRAPTRFSRQDPISTEQPVDHEAASQREKVLAQVGDLQSRMNVILNMVADFVSSVSGMIYKEPKEAKAINGVRPFEFDGTADLARKKEGDPREEEAKQRRAQVMFCGQKISSLLREVYELLSTTLNLQHNDFEMIYRSFKKHQKKRAMEQAIMSGSLQKYYGSGGRNTSYDYHRIHRAGSSLSGEDLGQQNVLLYGFHRSKSDLDVHSNFSSESLTTQFLRERSQVFLTHTPSETPQGRKTALGHHPFSREEVSIAKTTVPKKGLIKLTALDNERQNPLLFEKKEKEVLPMEAVREQQRKQQKYEKQRKMLIRRKDIMNQVNIGSLHLAEEKEKHDLEMQIENYTLGDLHRNINELTSTIRQPSTDNVKRGGNRMSNTKSLTPQPRGLALPAINTINLF